MLQRALLNVLGSAATRHIALAFALLLPSEAGAQSGQLKANFDQRFDCESPFSVQNHPIKSEFTATLNADRSANADLTMKGVIFTSTIHFEARLGGQSQAAPGGTSLLRVMPNNRLRGIWDLPNNQIILDIVSTGRSCRASLSVKLKPGKKVYSFYDGSLTYYCSKHRVLTTTCSTN